MKYLGKWSSKVNGDILPDTYILILDNSHSIKIHRYLFIGKFDGYSRVDNIQSLLIGRVNADFAFTIEERGREQDDAVLVNSDDIWELSDLEVQCLLIEGI